MDRQESVIDQTSASSTVPYAALLAYVHKTRAMQVSYDEIRRRLLAVGWTLPVVQQIVGIASESESSIVKKTQTSITSAVSELQNRLEETQALLMKLHTHKRHVHARSIRQRMLPAGTFFARNIARSRTRSPLSHLYVQADPIVLSAPSKPVSEKTESELHDTLKQLSQLLAIKIRNESALPQAVQAAPAMVMPYSPPMQAPPTGTVQNVPQLTVPDSTQAQVNGQSASVPASGQQPQVQMNNAQVYPQVQMRPRQSAQAYTQPVEYMQNDEDEEVPSVAEIARKSGQYKNPRMNDPNLSLKLELVEEKVKNLSNMSVNQRLAAAEPVQLGYYNALEPDAVELVSVPIGDRAQTGIPDLDAVIDGGFPRNTTMLVRGGPGTGKTTLALQYIINGIVLYNEPGLFITFEQSREAIVSLGKQYGWDIDNLEKQHMLIIREYTPEQLDKALASGGGSLRDMVDSLKAKRIVLDSLTEFLSLYSTELSMRKACTDLFRTTSKWECTSVVLGEEDLTSASATATVADYESDGIILLYNERHGDIRMRSLEILKMRDTRHAGRIFPLKMTKNGIVVRVKDVVVLPR